MTRPTTTTRTRRPELRRLLAAAAAAALLPIGSAHAGTFTNTVITGDADTSIGVGSAFTLALDVNDTGNRTVNGAVFTGTGNGATNPSTNNYATTGFNTQFSGNAHAGVTGNVGGLLDNFLYNGNPQTVTLNNLRVGQTYTTTFYQSAFGSPGGRVVNVTTSDGGALPLYDENATPGSELAYTFRAQSTSQTFSIAPTSPDTYHLYAVSNEVNGYRALLTDNYYAPTTPNTADVNFNLEARQGGILADGAATVSYTPAGNQQVGNPTGSVDNGNYLLSAAGGTTALNHNFNNLDSSGGLLVAFDMAPDLIAAGGANGDWLAINLGLGSAARNSFVNAATPHFGILFRDNGLLEAWDGSVNLTPVNPAWTTETAIFNELHRIELLLTDSTDNNPFDGVGQTEIAVYADGLLVFSFVKGGGGYADNFINFNGINVAGVDNLLIAQGIPTPAALPAGLALMGLTVVRRRSTALTASRRRTA